MKSYSYISLSISSVTFQTILNHISIISYHLCYISPCNDTNVFQTGVLLSARAIRVLQPECSGPTENITSHKGEVRHFPYEQFAFWVWHSNCSCLILTISISRHSDLRHISIIRQSYISHMSVNYQWNLSDISVASQRHNSYSCISPKSVTSPSHLSQMLVIYQ